MGENWEERLRDKDKKEAWRLFKGKVEQTVEKNEPRVINIRKKDQTGSHKIQYSQRNQEEEKILENLHKTRKN
jgi:hypothetical protein